ncbi:fibronectin type III domain-containing protein [Flavobacterium stagni]|uniref:Fibronectin type-III domain-containing protein n=1 Tax=Flavobacterium stagni TaxID=2506421 RepID=A0A4Q1K6S1_9FLAO|nr:fibronectin type III domain-containing protein [Flavobacterium stagni]RXR20259.1 hypothetical protein EQG61_12625 [Flavobacterium stagni]
MKAKNIFVIAFLLMNSILVQAQTIMNIHQNNGVVLQIPMQTIDSITYTVTTPNNLATITTSPISFISNNAAFSGGNITNNGGSPVTHRGICYNTSPAPTTANTTIFSGSGNGTFVSSLTGLTANTNYYVRAFATNSAGTSYGNELTFTTSNTTPVQPDIVYITDTTLNNVYYHQTSYLNPTKLVFSNLTSVSGNIYFHQTNNIVEVEFPLLTNTGGHVYFHQNLSMMKINAPNLNAIVDYLYVYGNSFLQELNLCNLTSITCSSQEPYIHIANNNTVIDNNQQCFTPTIYGTTLTTAPITQISQNTAIGGGTFTNSCGFPMGSLCWSTSPNPTSNDFVSNSSGSGTNFTANLTGLTPNTTYYVRAFSGNTYGNEVSFTTLP